MPSIKDNPPLPRICDVLAPYLNPAGTNASAPVYKCPKDKDWFFEVEGSSYQWNTALNGQRIDVGANYNISALVVSNGVTLMQTNFNAAYAPDSTPLFLDYDDFHPRPPKSGKNAVYMDGHATVFQPP